MLTSLTSGARDRSQGGLKYVLKAHAPIAQLAEAADLKSSELGVCCVCPF